MPSLWQKLKNDAAVESASKAAVGSGRVPGVKPLAEPSVEAAGADFAIKAVQHPVPVAPPMPMTAPEAGQLPGPAAGSAGSQLVYSINAVAGPGAMPPPSTMAAAGQQAAKLPAGHTNAGQAQSSSQRWQGGSSIPSAPACCMQYGSVEQFRVKRTLYEGSYTCVLQATCTQSGAEVVLKLFYKSRMSSKWLNNMRREVRLMQQLHGMAGVARILGHFEEQHVFVIVVEYCAGGDVYQRLLARKEGQSQLLEHWVCTKVIAPLLRVLNALHDQHGIVHRDIKPENLFLTENDELLLGDFGLAIRQQEELPFLRVGTLDYMAPEVLLNPLEGKLDEAGHHTTAQLHRKGFEVYNEKVDVWAVGVLAFELMTGQAPFFHEDTRETEQLIISCDLNPVRFPRHQLLAPWADFVRTTLDRDPASRPTASQLLHHRWVAQHQEKEKAALRHRSMLVCSAMQQQEAAGSGGAGGAPPGLPRFHSMPAMALAQAAQQAAAAAAAPPALARALAQQPCRQAVPLAQRAGQLRAHSFEQSVLDGLPSGSSSLTSLGSSGSLAVLADAAMGDADAGGLGGPLCAAQAPSDRPRCLPEQGPYLAQPQQAQLLAARMPQPALGASPFQSLLQQTGRKPSRLGPGAAAAADSAAGLAQAAAAAAGGAPLAGAAGVMPSAAVDRNRRISRTGSALLAPEEPAQQPPAQQLPAPAASGGASPEAAKPGKPARRGLAACIQKHMAKAFKRSSSSSGAGSSGPRGRSNSDFISSSSGGQRPARPQRGRAASAAVLSSAVLGFMS